MKKTISILLIVMLCVSMLPTAFAASFDTDSGVPMKAPLISNGTTSHPDTTKVYDFNNETLAAFPANGDSFYTYMNMPSVCVGSSGEESDKAYYFVSKTNEAFTTSTASTSGIRNQIYMIYDTKLGDSILSWQGKQVVEFDVKADNSNGRLGFMMWYMWASGYNILTENGKINGTDYAYPIDEWFHIKMVFEKHYWNVYVTDSDGEHHIVDNVKATGTTKPGNTWSQGSRMAFLFSQPNAVESEEERMGYTLDNIHAYRLYPEDDSNDISNYVMMSYSEAHGENSDKLPDTGMLHLDFGEVSDATLFNTENIILEDADGNGAEYEATYENNVYTIAPKNKLVQAAQYKLKISDEIRKMLNSDMPPSGSLFVTVRDDRPIVLGTPTFADAPVEGSELTVTVPVICNITDGKNVGAVVCIYNQKGGLASISRKNVTVSEGETEVQLSLIVPDDYNDAFGIKVFLTEGSGIRILDEKNI